MRGEYLAGLGVELRLHLLGRRGYCLLILIPLHSPMLTSVSGDALLLWRQVFSTDRAGCAELAGVINATLSRSIALLGLDVGFGREVLLVLWLCSFH